MNTGLGITVRVIQKRLEAEGIVSLRLAGEGGVTLPGCSAGSHIDVEVAPGVVRQYSLCNPSVAPAEYEIAVLREPASRGGSAGLHETVQVGDRLRISEPRNHFALDAGDAACLLLAGGIGITPILAMAAELEANDRPYRLHYCVRSADRAAYAERVAAQAKSGTVAIHCDDGPAEQRLALADVLRNSPQGCGLYVCGPAGFIDWVLAGAEQAGWGPAAIHREYFAAPEPAGDAAADRPFTVRLARRGTEIAIGADETVAAALERAGVFVPVSCAEGICGTCVVDVLAGEPEHRDLVLSDAEHAANTKMTVCCSRAKGEVLTLDL